MIRRAASISAVVLLTAAQAPVWAQTPVQPKGQQTPTRSLGQSPSNAVPTTPPGPAPSQSNPSQGKTAPSNTAQDKTAPSQGKTTQAPAAQPPQAAAPAKVPMSADSYTQALYQSEGVYPDMKRQGSGGQIQEAWNTLDEPRQGVYATRLCEDCVYKIRTREFMTTTIALPEDAVIAAADLGDPVGFKVAVKAANMIAVRPTAYGLDTNLNVYSKSGAVYPFYIRSESYNSKTVPDVLVRLLGREKPAAIGGYSGDAPESPRTDKGAPPKPGDKTAAAIHDLTSPAPTGGDFVRAVPFDPSKLHGWQDYKLWGDEAMKPVVVYRDTFFTYVQYGEKFDVTELPAAYVTIDGIDELVNSRVQGGTFIVESVSPLITLKNGKSYLCIQYTGETP